MQPSRGLLLVKPIESAERLPGSLILLTADTRERMTAHQAEVVAVGAFAACEDEDCEREHAADNSTFVCTNCGSTRHASSMDCALCGVGPTKPLRVHPHTIRVGDWILHAPRASIGGPDPEDSSRFVHQDAVWMIFGTDT